MWPMSLVYDGRRWNQRSEKCMCGDNDGCHDETLWIHVSDQSGFSSSSLTKIKCFLVCRVKALRNICELYFNHHHTFLLSHNSVTWWLIYLFFAKGLPGSPGSKGGAGDKVRVFLYFCFLNVCMYHFFHMLISYSLIISTPPLGWIWTQRPCRRIWHPRTLGNIDLPQK